MIPGTRRIGGIIAALAAAVFMSAAPLGALDDLASGTVAAVIDGRKLSFAGAVGTVERTRGGNTRITIALADRTRRVELTIAAECEEIEPEGEMRFTSEYNDVLMVYKTRKGGFTIMPAVRLAKDSGLRYVPARTRGDGKRVHDGSGKKERPEWSSMDRAERLASGKGVIRNRRMEGSVLYLALTPSGDGGKIAELRGTFSGTAKTGGGIRGGGRFITVQDGRFRVPVRGRR